VISVNTHSSISRVESKIPVTLTSQQEIDAMKNLLLVFGLSLTLTGCVTATLATAVVKTTAAVITLPVKAVGAAAKAITPDNEGSDEAADESD
jgi:hypothetical protein